MQFRSTRLALAVTAVLTVTALGAGTLATAPAALAAGPVAAPTQKATGLPVYPEGTDPGGVGASGFLTYFFAADTSRKLLWTPYDGGPRTLLQAPEDGGWSVGAGDVVVTGDKSWVYEMQSLSLRNMAAPSAPAVGIDLRPLNGTFVSVLGPTSVLAQLTKADGTTELHVVTKDGAATNTRKVTGLPADATEFFGSEVRGGVVLVGYETGPANARTGGRAVVDTAAGTATETYASAEAGRGFGGLQFSASHVAWYEYESGTGGIIRSVDRRTREAKRTVLGAHDAGWYTSLVGDRLVYGNPKTPVRAVSLATGEVQNLLDSGSAALTAPDGTAVVRGARAADGKGLFRIDTAQDGTLKAVKVADEAPLPELAVDQVHVPDTVDLDRTGGKVTLGWTLSRPDAFLDVTLTHIATGQEFRTRVNAPAEGTRFSFTWDGTIDGVDAPNGSYGVEAEATALAGTGEPASQGWLMKVSRAYNPHDYTNNGSTDVLARDKDGVVWLDDLRDRPADGTTASARRTRAGWGWGIYRQAEAVGDIAGSGVGDLVAVDGSGVLWHYLGKGDGTFAARQKVGGGWQVYDRITGGSDLDGDGRADLVAVDKAGDLYLYKGTGNASAPYAARKKTGHGWGIYNQITAVGNIAGGAAGDLVARDKDGVLWLYLGKGDGTFAARTRIGGGWNAFTQLAGAGDVDDDGRPDLIAYGAGGTYVYSSTGSYTAPFTRRTTALYAGEGTAFDNVL
ncbi:FG-GAP-like repeat-containing protein [Streptomyces sp. NPDC098101]|uniref:FG-GAP-like repeat-containing protein n=1 Tax=Streptomyces sp. NPDC098101 TaxID=3366096 RepID=UPI0037FE4B40